MSAERRAAVSPTVARGAGIRELVVEQLVRTVFQPIVDLDTGAAIGYEALSRGPAGGGLESPAALFGAAV